MRTATTAGLATDVAVVVGRLTRRLRQEAAGGLTPSQLSALASVERLGPVQLGEVARVEAVAAPTLTRCIAHLEGRGLVRRRPDPRDRRAALVDVTAAGRRALTDVRSARAAYLAQGLDRLSDEERDAVATAVRALDRLLAER